MMEGIFLFISKDYKNYSAQELADFFEESEDDD